MRIFQIISWAIAAVGFLFKLSHYPGGSLFFLLGTTLLLIHALVYLVKHYKDNLIQALFNASIALWMMYVLYRIQFWPGAQPIYWAAFALSTGTLIYCLTKKSGYNLKFMLFITTFLLSSILGYTGSYKIHSFVNLNPIFYADGRAENYYEWDKQTWFCYIAGEEEEALKANEMALSALEHMAHSDDDRYASRYFEINDISIKDLLEQRKQRIKDRTWASFP